MTPAIFLDRDGVLTAEHFRILRPNNIEIFPFARSCIESIHQLGYLAIVITNQSGISRGLFTIAELEESNRILMQQTGIDEVFYCPHHPEEKCSCRKPAIELIERATEKYSISLQESYMAGDRASDIQAGKNAGIKTVLLESGYGKKYLEQEIEPDYYFQDLRGFVKFLKDSEKG